MPLNAEVVDQLTLFDMLTESMLLHHKDFQLASLYNKTGQHPCAAKGKAKSLSYVRCGDG